MDLLLSLDLCLLLIMDQLLPLNLRLCVGVCQLSPLGLWEQEGEGSTHQGDTAEHYDGYGVVVHR